MPFKSPEALEEAVLRLQIVNSDDYRDVVRGLAPQKRNVEGIVETLENHRLVTSYQAGMLRRGDVAGLRLGPYKLLYKNAAGSFAKVYRAESVVDGRQIGIKLLRSRWASDARLVDQFRREGELGKRLKHKHIVPIYDVVSEGAQHYFTMEFVEGGNLREILRIRKKFPAEQAARHVMEMALGLEYANRLGLTHRDLKLTNVLLSSTGVCKLVDFGLAGRDASAYSMNSAGAEVDRAVEYATLEKNTLVAEGDVRSDLYFLGAIFYELLSGAPPYPPTADADERRQFSRYRDVKPIREVDPNVPPELDRIVSRLMNINPHDRYQSARDVVVDLRAYLGIQPSASSARNRRPEPEATVMFLEKRPKHQDALREYFSKHNYRVLMLTDPQRAMARLEANPPDAVVVMADMADPDEVPQLFARARDRCAAVRRPLIFVLSKKLAQAGERLQPTAAAVILNDPVTMRTLRTEVANLIGKKKVATTEEAASAAT